jgi:hypothetical protein
LFSPQTELQNAPFPGALVKRAGVHPEDYVGLAGCYINPFYERGYNIALRFEIGAL